jgi:hypothetical protein
LEEIRMQTARTVRTRADLEDYVAAFNGKDYEWQIGYYHPDVEYKVGTLTMSGPRAIADFYADFHQHSDEHVVVHDFIADGDQIAVTLPSWFGPFRDYHKNGLAFTAGEERNIVSFGIYTLKDGQIHRIRVARYNGPISDFPSARPAGPGGDHQPG